MQYFRIVQSVTIGFFYLVILILDVIEYLINSGNHQSANYGTEFYFSVPVVHLKSQEASCESYIDVASESAGHLEVLSFFDNWSINRNLKPGVTAIDIPCNITKLGTYQEYRGIYVKTDVVVALYVTGYRPVSQLDIYTVLPLESLGTKYVIASYEPVNTLDSSYIQIVGVENNTNVRVFDKVNVDSKNVSRMITLNRLELFQLARSYDLTEIEVDADKPIAVVAGVTCASVPHDVQFCDPIFEQMLPVNRWSKTYIVPPIPPQTAYTIKILKTDQTQTIKFENKTSVLITYMHDTELLYKSLPTIVSSNVPFNVVQYGVGRRFSNLSTSGDPFMTVVPGIEDYRNEYFFALPQALSNFYNHLAIIVQSEYIDTILLDGNPFNKVYSANTNPIHLFAKSEIFTVLIGNITPGFHHLRSSNSNATIGVMVYGFQDNAGYGYYAGLGENELKGQVRNVTVTASVGGLLKLQCGSGSAVSSTSYTWTKQNSCHESMPNFTGDTYTVSDVDFGDAGLYICKVTNGRMQTTEFTVQIQGGHNADLCTFDDQTLCGWSQEQTDNFDWTLQSGPTQSEETGPDNDHTLRNEKGSYLYIESSAPRNAGDRATIESHNMPGGEDACLSFWYYLYGDGIGTLTVLTQDSCTKKATQLFRVSGEKGEQWIQAKVDVSKANITNDYKFLIEATVGPTYHGDIAIDDVQLYTHKCSGDNPQIIG